jgi:modified peptide precursor CbpA
MVKDSDEQQPPKMAAIRRNPFLLSTIFHTKGRMMKPQVKTTKKDVIAYRKSCQAKGTGLSHYILMDKKAK